MNEQERAALTACVAALRGVLISADCMWESQRQGHDWPEALVAVRAALAQAEAVLAGANEPLSVRLPRYLATVGQGKLERTPAWWSGWDEAMVYVVAALARAERGEPLDAVTPLAGDHLTPTTHVRATADVVPWTGPVRVERWHVHSPWMLVTGEAHIIATCSTDRTEADAICAALNAYYG